MVPGRGDHRDHVHGMAVIVMVRLAENQRADDVDHQPEDGDHDRFLVLDRLRRDDPLDRADHHHHGHAKQEDGAGEAAQHLDLPGAEREARVLGVAPGRGVGHRRKADRHGMGAHVPAVRQQGHRVVPPAGGDLDHHHGGGDPHHHPRAALGGIVAGVKDVVVHPIGQDSRYAWQFSLDVRA